MAGYFWWQKKTTVSGSKTNNETVNWKTYTNSEESFGFSYPAVFTIKNVEVKNLIFSDTNEPYRELAFSFTTGKIIEGNADWSGFSVIVMPSKGKSIMERWNNIPGWANTTVKITNVPVKNGADEAAILDNTSYKIIYKKGDNFYMVAPFQNSNSYGAEDISKYLDQIISTFKFQGDNVTTVNWKNYSDKVLGISFNYPDGWNVSAQAPGSDYYILVKNNVVSIVITEGLRDPNAHSVKLQGIDTIEKLSTVLSKNNLQPTTDQKVTQINGYQALSRTVKSTEEIYILDGKGKVIIITYNGNMVSFGDIFDQMLSSLNFLEGTKN